MKHIILVGLIIILMSVLYTVQNKNSINETFLNKNTERLVFNGKTYELWKNNSISMVFNTYEDYMKYYNFSARKNDSAPLKPTNRLNKLTDGSILDPRFVHPKYFNIEHFNASGPSNDTEEVKRKKDTLIRDSQEIILQYLEKNPVCKNKLAQRDNKFYVQFQSGFSSYMREEFQKRIGYVPEKGDIESMTLKEAEAFVSIYRDLPDCDTLISKYSKVTDPQSKNSGANNAPNNNMVDTTTQPPVSQINPDEMTGPALRPTEYVNLASQYDNTGLMDYIRDIGTTLEDISFKLDQNLNNYQVNNQPADKAIAELDKQSNKYINESVAIANKIANDNSINANNSVQPSVSSVSSTTTSVSSTTAQQPTVSTTKPNTPSSPIKDITSPDNLAKHEEAKNKFLQSGPEFIKQGQNINNNFAYKPEYNTNHMEPSKEVYAAYGWSYMPPQSWSVPQKRPPVCIPAQGQQNTVAAIYDKSVPTDALDWTQVGSILPKFEYKEVHNPDFYHPGWVAGQEEIKYPFNPKNFKSEYYAYNLAAPTSEYRM
jgi:hypothetical protein